MPLSCANAGVLVHISEYTQILLDIAVWKATELKKWLKLFYFNLTWPLEG